jgi:hypothetical protein
MLVVFLAPLLSACGMRVEMPEEPQDTEFTGEIAYVVQYRWEEMPAVGDMVLTRGQSLYVVEDSTRVAAYFSNRATPSENAGRSIPHPIQVNGDELTRPVQICEGAGNTLWVAFAQPHTCLVQFDLGQTPPRLTQQTIEDPALGRIGGITADLDSGYVYIADCDSNRISKYEPTEDGGRLVAILASEGNGDHFVREPHGLFFFNDSLLVADSGKSWLQVIDADVPFSGRGQVQGTEFEPLQLHKPLDVWVDASGRYYVADTGNARVLQLAPAGEVKEVVTEQDSESALQPQAVVANTTQVWVSDPQMRRLTIYQINTVSEDLL